MFFKLNQKFGANLLKETPQQINVQTKNHFKQYLSAQDCTTVSDHKCRLWKIFCATNLDQ